MKSVISAAWLLTVAGGNVIVAIVAEAKMLDQVSEFFMFGSLMIVGMGIMIFLAKTYRYVSEEEKKSWQEAKQEPGVPGSQGQDPKSESGNHIEISMAGSSPVPDGTSSPTDRGQPEGPSSSTRTESDEK